MAQKRRIMVAFEGEGSAGEKRQKKMVISIDENATNGDLAREIAATSKTEEVTLEVAGGFELRDQDGIDVILDGEVVFATEKSPMESSPLSGPSDVPPIAHSTKPYITQSDEPGRMQIRLVTAQLAREHARDTPREQSEPANGVLAFDGEYISGNTSLNALQQEAARLFGWTSEDSDVIGDVICNHEQECACSCAVAQEVEQNGLFSTLHCRFTIDGTLCLNEDCPYSHVELIGETATDEPPHCSICTDALGFPCPTCMEQGETLGVELGSLVYCPLVQNAGCGHLHHAHCLGLRNDSTLVGCPFGCPLEKFPREARVLDMNQPHVVIIWDGDKIDKVPVPIPREGFPAVSSHSLTTDMVTSLVENFLSNRGFELPGLSLRIHSRDPVTETVRFTQSTLLSVCPSSTHTNQNYRRFELFSGKSWPSKTQGASNREYAVDFHTSQSPIVACGCTRLKQLFTPTRDSDGEEPIRCVELYVVRRKNESTGDISTLKRVAASKQGMYLADAAWQPTITQSSRGMAALLSSLYLLAHSVGQKGIVAEQKVLAMLYAITRFPPAVRALGVLLMNRTPQPEERAALSEALYHAMKEFGSRGPIAIAGDPARIFESVRILLAHIQMAAAAPSLAEAIRPMEDIPLICAVSHKRLTDPVILDSLVVQRALCVLRQRGGELYRPTITTGSPIVAELEGHNLLEQLLSHSRGLSSKSTLCLRVENIGISPPSCSHTLDSIGRDFLVAIKRANETDLITRGPLELKSAGIVAPQIVLDGEGLLAVFTGRGCGTTRDVNFFRPTNGGDTEVDVNDISHTLEKVITLRKMENTWQIDSFGGVSDVSTRPPDEAVVICLDLSESMNQRSGVSRSSITASSEHEFDHEAESLKVVENIVRDTPPFIILNTAKSYLARQHPSCYHAWKSYLGGGFTAWSARGRNHLYCTLIKSLGCIARRDLLRMNSLAERFPQRGRENGTKELAHFASASVEQQEALAGYLVDLLDNIAVTDTIGFEPFDVPRNFLDPRTGDLLTDPVCPRNAPNKSVYVNVNSKSWFESLPLWPSGHFVPSTCTTKQAKKAVANWISGNDLLPLGQSKRGNGKTQDNDNVSISVTLNHDGKVTVWHLLTSATTRTLYSLANRMTGGRYSSFTLRLFHSKVPINCSANLTLGLTDLSCGGDIEISRAVPHGRRPFEIDIQFQSDNTAQKILLPRDASTLSLISYIHAARRIPLTDIMLWHDLKKAGDGVRRGTLVNNETFLRDFAALDYSITFECQKWFWRSSGAQRDRETSRYLTRLHLLKELFNIFLNRAGSFDTSVSLVLGLVTFSDQASVKQELTPVFENFRQQLDEVSASGDTAVYDALDTARRILTNYRGDLPKLRRRIIIVSDGADTGSQTPAREVCCALQKSKVLVDSVQVGIQGDSTLHAISVATGGYRFSPQSSLSDALSIFDLETMLHSAERPFRRPMPPVLSDTSLREYGNENMYPTDIVTVDRFPQRAEHAKLQQSVKPAATLIKATPTKNDRTKRIMQELKVLVADPHPYIDLYVNDQDISFFKIILEAPQVTDGEKCPYKGGTFLLTCDLPEGYPRDPPEIRFVTFILHLNVSKQGKVCVAELGRLWSSDITLKETFSLIYGLLLEPDLENPLEIQASLKYYDDDGTYALAVANAIAKHASKTRKEWQQELEGD